MSKENKEASSVRDTIEPSGVEHTVFLGLYNADKFKEKIVGWLRHLNLDNTELVVADNCSSDKTRDWIDELGHSVDVPVKILRNERNYGGYGNLAQNLDKFPGAKWITTLHQDDSYKSNHIEEHRRILAEGNFRLGMICSEASSRLSNGMRISFPRANWVLPPNSDGVTVFLANLKRHTFPFSGATFSREVIEKFEIPWYSTAFPDTELVLKMCADYEIKLARGVTVEYLENPKSESHELTESQRDFGAFQALVRVFGHPTFKKICNMVPEGSRVRFINELVEGINSRFNNLELGKLASQIGLESAAANIGMFPELATKIAVGYASIGDHQAVQILSSLGSAHHTKSSQKDKTSISSPSISSKCSQRWILRILTFTPRWAVKFVFVNAMRIKLIRKKVRNWNFQWDRD
jgi:glycosyltransferase involved in cell wall biosynthesis